MVETGIVLSVILFCGFVGCIDGAAWKPHATRVTTALRLANISLKEAAYLMDIDKSLLHRQLLGEGHLSYTRLARLPKEFWSWFALLTAQDEGLPPIVRAAAHLHMAVNGTKKHMAQMVDAETSDSERWA